MLPAEDLSLYQAFFGQDSAYYLRQLQKSREGKRLSYNPATTLLGCLWLIYRKLYKAAAIVVAVLFTIFIGTELLIGKNGRTTTAAIVLLSAVVFWITLGFFANKLYLSRAEAVIANAKSFETENEQLAYVRSNGGVSRTAAFLLIGLIALAVLFTMFR
jgi:hypothetical protein